jgi:hypothetical protein
MAVVHGESFPEQILADSRGRLLLQTNDMVPPDTLRIPFAQIEAGGRSVGDHHRSALVASVTSTKWRFPLVLDIEIWCGSPVSIGRSVITI